MRRLLTLAAVLALASQAASAGTLDRIRDTGVFRIGYRADAKPYSYQDRQGQPAGYIVDLCLEVAAALGPNIQPAVCAGARRPAFRSGARRARRHPVRSELRDHCRAGRSSISRCRHSSMARA